MEGRCAGRLRRGGLFARAVSGSGFAAVRRQHQRDEPGRSGVDTATLQDLPIAIFYKDQPQGQSLRFVDQPVGRGYYVMYTKQGEDRLSRAINEAIEKAILSGELRQIYEKWHLWTPGQEDLQSATAAPPAEKAIGGWRVVRRYAPRLSRTAGMTVLVSVIAMPLAIVAGLLIALGRLYGPAIVRVPLAAYVEILRGTPLMLQLFVLFFVLPSLLPESVRHWPVVAAVLDHWSLLAAISGLAINYSAYEAEIYRAGLQAIPGQMEAALSLGMSRAARPAAGHRAAGGAHRHPAGDERLHRAVQGHVGLLGRRA